MEIKRDIYLQKLVNRMHNGMIKVVTGIRRCGKSYLLFNIFKSYLLSSGVKEDHIIELSLDSVINEKYREASSLYDHIINQIKDDDVHYVLLDEVQFVPHFEDALNGLIKMKNLDVYVTGSNAKFLSKDIITEFRGRGDEVRVYPLSFKEYMSVSSHSVEKGLEEYMYFGGLPQLCLMPTNEQKTSYLINLFKETYLKDIINRNKISNEIELNELLNVVSSSVGSLTNPNKLADTFKTIKKVNLSAPTISKYLECLEDSFLINKAYRYDLKGKKYIGAPLKYYFVDVGLRNARINFRQNEKNHIMENIIFNEFSSLGYNIDVGIVPVSIKNEKNECVRKNLEVDFVCNKIDKRIYVQSAYTIPSDEKYEQEIRSLNKIDDSFMKIVITKDPIISHYTEEGILLVNIYDFLLNPEKFGI